MTPPPRVAEIPRTARDRTYKFVAAVAAACLIGFVVFVIVRGSAHQAPVGSSRSRWRRRPF